ncbi:oligosaccharide flippase family protein [Flammeovirga yaeyamensis]|uniref:Oligosaccharide flippase family protein n=1 Tax=Flammeovirga yaeyamensis TaxID=367791 RepID=A0AAX1N2W5_9BACT|nr:oligosaccharide flippase family protein [Flammeovirga yaeyamensis]MBB3700959.1 O-antigen/teichoic acid export membrane protein [Flammeovirga yaeyamensis]NMF38066.1 oligosaccharide flippase family protein [Flammeovirga yaeyamensis]QWG00716.1 oligosaccharide flippase family protein [Flammeovirga yaeyamensis]
MKNISKNTSKEIINGSLWLLIQTIGNKATSFVSQIVLAKILMPETFGKMAIILTITNITSFVQQIGLNDILIKRGKSFDLWKNLTQTIALIISILSIVILMIAAKIGSIIYNDYSLLILIPLYSISIPFNALAIIPESKLRIDLKFKAISIIKISETLMLQIFTIIGAYLGLEVYSFILPYIIVGVIKWLMFNYASKNELFFKLKFKYWKYIINDSIYVFLHSFASRITFQADYAILGLFASQNQVGVYYMAYTLSVQVVGFVANNLPQVLFPSLVKLKKNKSDKLYNKYIENSFIITTIIGTPFAMLQFTCAEPIIHFFFDEKWFETIKYIQILSIGMVFRTMSSNWVVPLKSEGNFKKMSKITNISSIIYIIIILILSKKYSTLGTSIGVTLYYFLITPLLLFTSLKNTSDNIIKSVLRIYFPCLIGIIIYLSIYFVLKNTTDNQILLLTINCFLPSISYSLIIFTLRKKLSIS